MQGYEAGFSELRSVDGQDTFRPVHVIGLELQRLTQPQARDCKQPKQTVIGLWAQGINRRPSLGSVQEFSDLVIGIEVRLRARWSARQQTQWWHFGRGIRGTPMPGEAADDAQSRRPLPRCMFCILRSPLQRQIGRNSRTVLLFQ